jgi:hypothetical protein
MGQPFFHVPRLPKISPGTISKRAVSVWDYVERNVLFGRFLGDHGRIAGVHRGAIHTVPKTIAFWNGIRGTLCDAHGGDTP